MRTLDRIATTIVNDTLQSDSVLASEEAVGWLERTLPAIMRRLLDSDDLDLPLLQLPLAQLRLAHALYTDADGKPLTDSGETMGHLSERLGVRHNALTQVADRLATRGLIERVPDPEDRRLVRLRLTETGQEWVSARRERRRLRLQALWNGLSEAERKEMLDAVRVLERAGQRLKQNLEDVSASSHTITNAMAENAAAHAHPMTNTVSKMLPESVRRHIVAASAVSRKEEN